MNRRFIGLRRLSAFISDPLPVAEKLDSSVDPFDLPYLKPRPIRLMPYYAEKTLYVWRGQEFHRNAKEKEELRKKKEAGIKPNGELSTLFRVQLDAFDYCPTVSLPEVATFAEAAEKMSTQASSMLTNRVSRMEKKLQNVPTENPLCHDLSDLSVRVSADDMTRSLKQTLLDDDVVNVEILVRGKTKRRIPYAIQWLQYPLSGVSLPMIPREGFPMAAYFEHHKSATTLLFDDVHHVLQSFPHGLKCWWFTMEPATKSKNTFQGDIEWEETTSGWRPTIRDAKFVCESPTFTPTEEHVGKFIAVAASCIPASRLTSPSLIRFLLSPLLPRRSSSPSSDHPIDNLPCWTVAGRSTEVVVAKSIGGELLATPKMEWARRDEKEREESGDTSRLRLVSYNLLADQYLNLAKPPAELFYPYVDKKYQHMRYRYSLHLKEIEAYAADLYFLQECCQKMTFHYLAALFKQMNYGFDFRRKFMEVREGSGLAWNLDRFEQRNAWCSWLTDVLLNEEENEDIRQLLARATPEDRKFFEDRPTLVHIVQLEDRATGDCVMATTTHLHHDPRHEHLKAIQTAIVARQVARRVRELVPRPVRVLFGCDLNSTPEAAAVALLRCGRIAVDDPVWDADTVMGGMELRLPDELRGMVNLSGEPPFTNYTLHNKNIEEEGVNESFGFAGCIDYIWACGLETVEVAEQPTREEIEHHTALPSPIAGSDHLAIVLSARYNN
ncbi:hypothetical protein PENTCL1PPCAC_12830 [Pristionchus entomophagus]|uniref:Endonuclease/exonuclease/phosphatase domain-containing protein n=1 Tax=Pristionchus entomophagus TaxID=358040 RepID=A0AAV5T6B4_9BILA|nr:hypothetical protein PENTCL1PPCAC_12830 [Pristionchus entomophagus]